jgi:hypothetical protein
MWFFGDYGSKQQYLALKCTLWAYRQRPIDDELKTPGFDFAEGWLFDNNVRVVYIHAGMNSVPPAPVVKKDNGKNKGVKCKKGDKKCIAKNARLSPPPQSPPPPAHGLTGDFMAAHGLTHTAGMDVVVRPQLTLCGMWPSRHRCMWNYHAVWLAYIYTQLNGTEASHSSAGCPKR